MKKITNEILNERMNNLSKEMKTGFDNVIRRLDITNGKVLGNTEWINRNHDRVQGIDKMNESIQDVKLTIAKWVGVITGLGILINILIRYYK